MATADGGYPDSVATRTIDGGDPGPVYVPGAPLLTALTDAAPCPRVVINFTEFTYGTVRVTIYRVADGVQTVVPGANNIAALGGAVRTDYYAPFGIPITYLAEMFDADGLSMGYTARAETTVDTQETWLSSPFDPKKSLAVELGVAAGSALMNPVAGQLHEVAGRRILIAETTYGLSGLNMSFWTDSIAEYRVALDLFKTSNSFVVYRTPPPMEVPRVLYAYGVPERSETNLPAGIEEFYWDVTVSEVSPPTTVILVGQISYGRFMRYYPTYGAFKAAYATYRDAQLNPPPEV